MRIGTGFDIHRLKKGRKFILGGMEIPCEKGLVGHSDADLLIHSICDAILGALGKPDIGYYFPDSDPAIKGISSVEILKKVLKIMEEESYIIGNIDAVVICEIPELMPHFPDIKENLSHLFKIERNKIGLKAKTFERIGEIGKGEAVACLSSVLLIHNGEKN